MKAPRAAASTVVALLVTALIASPVALAAGQGEPGPYVRARVTLDEDESNLRLLLDMRLDVDAVFDGWARVYLVPEELQKLRTLGYDVLVVPEEANILAARSGLGGGAGSEEEGVDGPPAKYHTYTTLTNDLQDVANDHPDIVRLSSLGQTVEGRELWMMKISRNPDVAEDEPGVAYISSMHGDEVVGKELCMFLIDHLTDNDGTDARVTALLDDLEIWIMPSMNPDGTEAGVRYNSNFVDLNRNFPDQFDDPVNTPDGREPETAAVMAWGAAHTTVLSANFHGGALVANYPYDGNTSGFSVYSPSPDDGVFVSLARTYADANPPMASSNGHPSFDNGICNGSDWYAIYGGMQDWHYVWRGNEDITLEVSNTKWPDANTLNGFWDDNRESMLAYLERAREGVRGLVTDADTGLPVAATVTVVGSDRPSYTDPAVGDYHRILLPGRYTLEVEAPGYRTALLEDVDVAAGPAVRYDVALEALAADLRPIHGCADGAGCDPWLAAGQAADLKVTLRNLGVAASGVAGELVPTGWFAGITRPSAGYPDLAPGAAADSAAPHHGVTVDPAVPAGHKLGFALRWSSAVGSGLSEPFFVPAGTPQCSTRAAVDTPLSILDRQTSTSTLSFADEREIADVRVTVDVDHTYRGDLRLTLVSPAGTPVILHDRSGGSADDIVGTFGVDLTAFESLTRVSGESSLGMWELRAHDGVPGNTGTLASWSLEICGRPFESQTPEMRLRDVTAGNGAVHLSWWPYPGMQSYRVYRSTDPTSAGAFVDVTSQDDDAADTRFTDAAAGSTVFYLVTAEGPNGEGPKGHFGE